MQRKVFPADSGLSKDAMMKLIEESEIVDIEADCNPYSHNLDGGNLVIKSEVNYESMDDKNLGQLMFDNLLQRGQTRDRIPEIEKEESEHSLSLNLRHNKPSSSNFT